MARPQVIITTMSSTHKIIDRLRDIFNAHGWSLSKKTYGAKFDRFCDLILKLNEQEQDVILTLAEDFVFLPFEKYPSLVEDCFNKIDTQKYSHHQKIFVVSLKAPSDTKKSKSGDSLLYSFAHQYAPVFFEMDPDKVILLPKINSLTDKRRSRKPALFLFADDFVGTGDTGFAAIDNFNRNIRVDGDSCILLSLVSMESGFNRLSSLVDEFVTSIIAKKGIKDSEKITDKANAYTVMKSIEDKLHDVVDYRYGFMQSESLVSLIRTPDNTFPVFWRGKDSSGDVWPAPFLRTE